MLSPAHSNLFIPSNLNGTCFDDEGKVDPVQLKANMDCAAEAYLKRVSGAPCGDGVIQLFKGADSSDKQEFREKCCSMQRVARRNNVNWYRTTLQIML